MSRPTQVAFLARRSYITLIEIMIVMALLAILGGVLAINIRSSIQAERFQAGVAVMVSRLQLAQDIMLIAHGDVHVRLAQEKEGVLCHLEALQALLPGLQRIVDRTGIVDGIVSYTWAPVGGREDSLPVVLEFKSEGARMARGELRLSAGAAGDRSAMQRYILLTGTPEPIVQSTESRMSLLSNEPNYDKLYPAEVKAIPQPQKTTSDTPGGNR